MTTITIIGIRMMFSNTNKNIIVVGIMRIIIIKGRPKRKLIHSNSLTPNMKRDTKKVIMLIKDLINTIEIIKITKIADMAQIIVMDKEESIFQEVGLKGRINMRNKRSIIIE